MQQNLRSGAEGWSGQQISRQLSKMGCESSNQMSPPTLVKQPSSLTLLSLWVWAETLAKVSNKCVSRHRACSGWTGGHSLAGGEACWRVLIAQYCLEKTATEQHSYECCKVVINSLRVVTVKNVLVCWFLQHCLSSPQGTEGIMQSLPSCFCAWFFDFFAALCLSKALFCQVQQKYTPLFPQWSSVGKSTTDQGPCFKAPEHTKHMA